MAESNEGEISAWHFATRQPVQVRWQEGVITHLETSAASPPRELWIAPPLFDLQINGYAGVDFQQDGLTLADLLQATRRLRAAGCARYYLTLITEEWHALTARLRHLRVLRAQSVELQSAMQAGTSKDRFFPPNRGFMARTILHGCSIRHWSTCSN